MTFETCLEALAALVLLTLVWKVLRDGEGEPVLIKDEL